MKWLSLAAVVFALSVPPATADEEFEKYVRPLLVEHCISCHGPNKQSGGLRLDSREAVLKGGDSKPAAVPGKPDESLLVEAVLHKGELRMPPKSKLADAQVGHLKAWVNRGMPWPNSANTTVAASGKSSFTDEQRNWWSFQPVTAKAPPQVRDASNAKTEIDRFLLASLEAKGLTFAPPADKRTLLRRVTFDLTGLPPTFAEVDAFVKDARPEAFALAVDRLLASPAYGERWGRHWLDVVRYADTAGENTDHPVADAWRYRNWVIHSFNRDQPYDEFVREQVAGDILAARGPEERYSSRLTATGFLAIARRFDHDSDKFMHLTFEDTIDTLGRAFMGLSIACARCHDHKYDPISNRDYYALYGILQSSRFPFAGCEAKQQPRDLVSMRSPVGLALLNSQRAGELAALDAESKVIAQARAAATARSATLLPKPVAKGDVPDGGSRMIGNPRGEPLEAIDVGLGEMIRLSVSPLTSHGADTTLVEFEVAEVGGQRRWNLTADVIDDFAASNPRPDRLGHPSVWWFMDARAPMKPFASVRKNLDGHAGLHVWGSPETPSVFANTGDKPARVWTELAARSVFVHPAKDGPVAVAWVSPFAGKVRISGRIADAHPGGPDGVGWSIDQITRETIADLKAAADLEARSAAVARRRAEFDRQETVYAVVEGKSGNARLHLRGDPEKLGPEVPRRWLELFGGKPVPADGGSGRLALADWLTDPKNPLTARVMANRVWQYHFGKGIVASSNDFGTRGRLPTHPELLDWLAERFVKDGWSVKALHRRILLSAVYQQSVAARPEAAVIDPNNDLYWRFDRRRLSAEELRDGLLMASGQLDRTPAAAHPFPPANTWNFTQHAPFSAVVETDKRSIYQTTLRNRRHPFFGLFDGADPNTTTPQRQVTTVPTQALFFLNDPFFHAQAAKISTRLSATADEAARLDDLYRLAFQRVPTAKERSAAVGFLRAYAEGATDVPVPERSKASWEALVRIVLASNESLYVE